MAATTPFPSATNPTRDLALQKYLLLQHQRESLRQHLDELRPLSKLPLPKTRAGTGETPVSSPTRAEMRAQSPFSSGPTSPGSSPTHCNYRGFHRRSSPPVAPRGTVSASALETVFEITATELEAEEAKLSNVNEGIKRALTELLNCETVRCDRAFRMWVQCRLMDTEKELRSGRRRRSNPEAEY